MHLKVQRRGNRLYLSVVQSYRENGKVRSRTVETIGYADDYADRFADPVAHFRGYVEELNAREKAGAPAGLSFAADETIAPSSTPTARLGAGIALGCLDGIGAGDFFRARAGQSGFPAQAGRIFEMLACERMMHATSKRESWTARESFPRPCNFAFEDVYAALPCFARERHRIQAHHLKRVKAIAGEPNVDRIFLVCGSYAFPIDGGAMRASIAIALDRTGMPLGYHDLMGRLEPASFRQATDALKEQLGARRAVVIAGGLRDPQPTIEELAKTGDGFVLYQRDYSMSPELAAWAQDDSGYTPVPGGIALKQRVATRANGSASGTGIPTKEIVLRGGGYALRQRQAVLVSSELDMSAAAIVDAYRELWRQAEPFQPLEADFASVPFPTAATDHIQAHFCLCYSAFLALRVLRWKMGWRHNAADTADALLRMEGAHLQRNYYLFNYRSDVTDDIETAIGIPPARRLRTRGELRSVPATVRASFNTAAANPTVADG